MNYINRVRDILGKKIDVESDLLDLYTLLVLTHGANTTNEHVHDAWSVWRNKTNPTHVSLVPFDTLAHRIQALDTEYAEAIRATARELKETEQ